MVAYSFKRRFVEPIRRGLGSPYPDQYGIAPKRQTIRADRRRHARPGEEVQLYCGMRTKQCFLIGTGRCTSVLPIVITEQFINIEGTRVRDVDAFAQRDGFKDWSDMLAFWREVNQLAVSFSGVVISWEPVA
jgi:hypothetical protein